jgi:hypothetical protein
MNMAKWTEGLSIVFCFSQNTIWLDISHLELQKYKVTYEYGEVDQRGVNRVLFSPKTQLGLTSATWNCKNRG